MEPALREHGMMRAGVLMRSATFSQSTQSSTLKLPTYHREGPSDTYLTQVRLATQIQGQSSKETAVCVALLLVEEALKILDNLLPQE